MPTFGFYVHASLCKRLTAKRMRGRGRKREGKGGRGEGQRDRDKRQRNQTRPTGYQTLL